MNNPGSSFPGSSSATVPPASNLWNAGANSWAPAPTDPFTTGGWGEPTNTQTWDTTVPVRETVGERPKKYVVIDGVMQLNPAYKAYEESQGRPATTVLYPDKALPVVSTMEQHKQLCDASVNAGLSMVPLAPSTNATIMMMQEDDICARVGVSTDEMVDGLTRLFEKHEIPLGLMNKLMILSEFHLLEFLIDDSGSMGSESDLKDKSGRYLTRWGEAQMRLKEMMELLSYVPTPTINIRFFNRSEVLTFNHSGQSPVTFFTEACQQIDTVFSKPPSGGTPARERLIDSFARGRGKKVSRYFFCDGVPDRGQSDIDSISEMVKKRPDPQWNPLTFISCSENDKDVEWMKVVEEIAPFCAECDDYRSEAMEVCRDQGKVFPFTKGFYLLSTVVAAMNPDDLDAMDECAPFTKFTFDNMLGIQTSEEDYRRYFQGFMEAQRTRQIEETTDTLKARFDWRPHYQQFLTERLAKNIEAVRQFKIQLERASASTQPSSVTGWLNSMFR